MVCSQSSDGGPIGAYYVDDRILAWDASLPRPNGTTDRFLSPSPLPRKP